MKIRIAFILLLCGFCPDIGAIFFSRETSVNKTCRLGTKNPFSDFEELPKFTSFVDKTLIVEEFFKNGGPRQFHLITCPPKFGKTTNLDTIRRFVQFDEKNRQLFNDSGHNLKITPLLQSGNHFLRDHFQNQKCIYVSFKEIYALDKLDILNKLRKRLQSTCEDFRSELEQFRLQWDKLPEQQRSKTHPFPLVLEIINSTDFSYIKEDEVVSGLSALARMVALLFPDKNITILIDDYDDPIRNFIEHSRNITDVDYYYRYEPSFNATYIHKLISDILSSLFLTPHPNLRYALITGTLNVLEQAQFRHIKQWNFLDNHPFTKYFGFTAPEVDHLLTNHFIESNAKSLVKQYYGPYSTQGSATEVYNPYSIVVYLSCGDLNSQIRPENYWVQDTKHLTVNFFNGVITKSEKFREIISQLLALKQIKFELLKYWSPNDLQELRNIRYDKLCKLTAPRINLILSYLFHNGYLSHGDKPRTYCVPSEEIRTFLNESLFRKHVIEDKSIGFEQVKSLLSPPS